MYVHRRARIGPPAFTRGGGRSLLLLGMALAVAGALAPVPARAADVEALIRQGIALRKDARDREALVLFQRAAEQERAPRTLAQLGLCEQAVGLWVDAEKHLQEAMRSPQDAWIQKNQAALRESLGRVQAKLGSLEVWGTPEGAAITVDGADAGALPMNAPARVVEGRKTVTVESPGYLSDTRTIEVRAGALIRERIVLTKVPRGSGSAGGGAASPPPPALAAVPPPESDPTAAVRADAAPVPEGNEAHSADQKLYRRWWFWAALGAVAAAGAVTAYLLVRSDPDCRTAAGEPCTSW